jgi:hypothetical protein
MFEYQLFCEISSFLYSTGTLPITPIPLAPYSRLITTNDAQSFPLSFLTPPTVQQRPLGTFTGDQLLWYELQLAHPLSLLGLFTGRNHRISAPPSLDHLDPLFFLDCSLLTPMISINNNSIPLGGNPRRCQLNSFCEFFFQLQFGPNYTGIQIPTGLSLVSTVLNGAGTVPTPIMNGA